MTPNPIVFLVGVDDELRILAAVKKAWGDRVTTVFPSRGKFAVLASDLPADLTVGHRRLNSAMICPPCSRGTDRSHLLWR